MKGRGSFFSFMKDNKKKISVMAIMAVCAGGYIAAAGAGEGDKAAGSDIPIHDGDVLVDSLSVEEEKEGGETDESALVTSDDVSELDNTDSYFRELRATLDMERNKIISMLTDSEASSSTKAEKENASAEKLQLMRYMEQEKTVETLIKNKGLPETFVVITENGVNVTVNTDDLDQSTVTKICDIVMRETGRKASEIVVQDVS